MPNGFRLLQRIRYSKRESWDLQGALVNYNKAIEANYPTEEKYIYYYNRGYIAEELEDYEGACKDYKVAATLGDEETNEWLNTKDGEWCKKM